MGRFLTYLGVIAALATSCVPTCRDTTLYQRSGRQKAIVAVLPVINTVGEGGLTWDLSREFTDEVRKRIYNSQVAYLLRDHGSLEIAEKLNTPCPSEISASQASNLGAAEFALVMELIEQDEMPLRSSENGPTLLSVAMRVRVIDLRHDQPKVILQEIVRKEREIARAYMACDYTKTPWGSEPFQRTPLGVVHQQLVRELVTRTEGYIEAAR